MAIRPLLLVSVGLLTLAACGGGGEPGPAAGTGPLPESPSGGGATAPFTGTLVGPDAGTPGGPGPSTDACTPFAGLPSRTGSLVQHLATVQIVRDQGENFREPSGTELVAFERAFESLVRTPSVEGATGVSGFGFTASLFKDQAGGAYLVFEDAVASRGAGTLIVNLAPARDLWLESPHADSDLGTLAQGARLLTTLGARAYLVTGANRCASSATSPCDGRSTKCGGQLRRADAAHYDGNFFTAAHRALRSAFPAGVAVNVHGMDSEGDEAAVLSDGTRADRPGGLSVRLRDALNRRLPAPLRAYSCNDASENGRYRPLCGTTNVQGRVDNGSTDACRAPSPAGTDRFIHLEQSRSVRTAAAGSELSAVVGAGLADVVACTLGGAGLGCERSEPVCR